MSLDEVFAAIDARGLDPKQHGNGWQSRCPAHDDENPSFSFGPGDNGNVVVKCHTGCSFAAIVAGTGLPESAFFPEKHGHAPRRKRDQDPIAEWVIRDGNGEPLAVHKKYLKPDKVKKFFLWFMADGVTPSKKGTANQVKPERLPLYGAHRFQPEGTVFLTEGEKACDALYDQGFVSLGTVTGASSCPCPEALELLRGRDVVFWPDNDAPGRLHRDTVCAAAYPLVRSLKIIDWPEAREKDDAFDYFARGLSADDLKVTDYAPPAVAPIDEPHTDLGIARRFVHAFKDDFRFSSQGWFKWDGFHWARDAQGLVTHTIAAVARQVSDQVKGDDTAYKSALRQESSSRINGAVGLAAVDPALFAAAFDSQPHLLTCKNAIVDLRDGSCRPPRKDALLSRYVPHDYDPEATCPRWERFLKEVCAERQELVTFLHRFVGYCLTGETRENALLLLIGQGRNGKTVFVETLMSVFGDDLAQPAAPGLLIASKNERHPAELMDLHGRRLVIASEVSKHATFSEERVKWLTGGDAIKAREFYGKWQTFRPSHKFIIGLNHLPTVKDPTDGFWRRLRVVPFDVSFKGREDKSLTAALKAEAPGILAWAVRGAAEWNVHGLGDPVVVQAATDEYREEENLLGRFLSAYRQGEERPLKAIHDAFKFWCLAEGEAEPKGGRTLGSDLKAAGWKKRRTSQGVLWSGPGDAELNFPVESDGYTEETEDV